MRLWRAASSAEADAASEERARAQAELEAATEIDGHLGRLEAREPADDQPIDQRRCDLVAASDIDRRGRRLRRARLLYDVCRRPEAAFAELARVIEMAPEWAEAYSERGHRLYQEKRCDEALADHDRAIELAPHWGQARARRASSLYYLERFEESLRDFGRAGELGFVMSQSDLGLLYGDDGQNDEVLPLYREHLEIRRRALGEAHPRTLGLVAMLTLRYTRAGRDAEAEALGSHFADLRPRPPEKEPDLRSVKGGAPTLFFVGNLTARDLAIDWLDYDGKRQRLSSLKPGEVISRRNTRVGYAYVVAELDGTALAIYLPEPGASMALVR